MEVVHILVLEDHPVSARGIKQMLTGVPGASSQFDIRFWNPVTEPEVQNLSADLFLISLNPRSAFAEIFERLRRKHLLDPKSVIIFCDDSEFKAGLEYLYKGVYGFVFKGSEPGELMSCIRALLEGNTYVCQQAVQRILNHFMPGGDIPMVAPSEFPLTPREFEVARELSRGFRVSEIAKRLNVTAGRVSICKAAIFKKLGIEDQHELSAKLFELSANIKSQAV